MAIRCCRRPTNYSPLLQRSSAGWSAVLETSFPTVGQVVVRRLVDQAASSRRQLAKGTIVGPFLLHVCTMYQYYRKKRMRRVLHDRHQNSVQTNASNHGSSLRGCGIPGSSNSSKQQQEEGGLAGRCRAVHGLSCVECSLLCLASSVCSSPGAAVELWTFVFFKPPEICPRSFTKCGKIEFIRHKLR